MAKPLNFFIECDPVVFDCWVVDKLTGKKLRQASKEEAALWQCLLETEGELQDLLTSLTSKRAPVTK